MSDAATEAPAVLTEERGGVLIITINRPEARNAVNLAVSQGIADAVDVLDARPDLVVGILTGAGGSFCAGMDLKAFLRGEFPSIPGRGLAGITEKGPNKPLIAAVEGSALAGGLEVAISCDLIVGSKSAKFGIPEAKRGLAAVGGGLLKLPALVGPAIAKELALTADPITADRAYEVGLINRVSEDGKALDVALEIAAVIAENGPLSIIASKKIIDEVPGWSMEERWQKQSEISGPVFTSEDAQEGPKAFAEKRKPVWKGR